MLFFVKVYSHKMLLFFILNETANTNVVNNFL